LLLFGRVRDAIRTGKESVHVIEAAVLAVDHHDGLDLCEPLLRECCFGRCGLTEHHRRYRNYCKPHHSSHRITTAQSFECTRAESPEFASKSTESRCYHKSFIQAARRIDLLFMRFFVFRLDWRTDGAVWQSTDDLRLDPTEIAAPCHSFARRND